MTARIPLIPGRTGGHRPPLQLRFLTPCVTQGGYKILQVFFVLQARVIQDAVTDLPFQKSPGCERLDEKHRIIVGDDMLERIPIGQSEALRHFQFIAMFVAGSV